jgi:hypothetical protein
MSHPFGTPEGPSSDRPRLAPTDKRYVRFPPGSNVYVPIGPPRAASTALGIYSACQRKGVVAQHLAWLSTRLVGGRILPGRPVGPPEGLTPEVLDPLLAEWTNAWPAVGRARHWGFYSRPHESWSAFAMLLEDESGRPLAFAKCHKDSDGVVRELRALERLTPGSPGFSAPRPYASGATEHWSWLLREALPEGPHRPAQLGGGGRLTDVCAAVATALADIPKGEDVPPHWSPMHGDLTPWNVRRLRRTTWLLDWEAAAYGPPHADEVRWISTATAAGMRVPRVDTDTVGEAVRFWRATIAAIAAKHPLSSLDRDIDAALVGLQR